MVEMFLASLLFEGNMARAIEPSQSYCRENFEPSDKSDRGAVDILSSVKEKKRKISASLSLGKSPREM